MRTLALLMNERLKKTNITYFVFTLPTLTLGTKLAPFLFTTEDIDYIYEILAQL